MRKILFVTVLLCSFVFAASSACQAKTLINVCKNNKWGYITTSGDTAITFQYDWAGEFNRSGVAIVRKGNILGIINKRNEFTRLEKPGKIPETAVIETLPILYSPNYMPVLDGEKFGYADKTGNLVIPYKYDEAQNFKNGTAVVKFGMYYGAVNKKDETVIPFKYYFLQSLSDKYYSACISQAADGTIKDCGIIDKNGKTVLAFEYYSTNIAGKDIYIGQITPNSWVYMDKKGKKLFDKSFALAGSFKEGLAAACSSYDKCGFINKRGNYVIKPQYETVSSFRHGLAAVLTSNGKWGFIDKKGNFKILPKYDWTGFIY